MATTPLRFTFVLARYGEDILGGAEKHARDVAEHLAQRGHDVRVLTTCAESYTTWKNARHPGPSALGGVEVVRFPVRIGRLRPFDEVTKMLASTLRFSRSLGWAWAFAQGPSVPNLVHRLDEEARTRDLVVFFGLLSSLTFAGLGRIGHKSALVPLVHEEPPIYSRLARETLALPRALLVNTEEEWARVRRVGGPRVSTGAIVAVGHEEPMARDASFTLPTASPYVMILGRAGKTRPMLSVWSEIVKRGDLKPLGIAGGRSVPWSEVKLVTVGEVSKMYERLPNVIQLPYVDEKTRWQLLWNATALVNPSVYESLSLVLLEAWTCGVPVVVNERCDVTVGQCRRSGGGFAIDFRDPKRGAVQLAEGLASFEGRASMGRGGEAYTRERYGWERVMGAYEAMARAVRGEQSLPEVLAPWAAG